MQAWALFSHSVRQVFGNLGGAFKVLGILSLVQAALWALAGPSVMNAALSTPSTAVGRTIGLMALISVASGILSLWMTVAWHRYILKNEASRAPVPAFRLDRVLSYLGHSILVGLILLPVVLVCLFFLLPVVVHFMQNRGYRIGAPGGALVVLSLVSTIVVLPVVALAYRLSVILPAAAIGQPMRIGEGWAKMTGTAGTMFALALISVLAAWLIDLPVSGGLIPGQWPLLIWAVIANWVKWVVGISILTTLYGHYVEGRPLVGQATSV